MSVTTDNAGSGRRPLLPYRLIVEERLDTPRWLPIAIPMISVAIALLIGAVVMATFGTNPWIAYARLFAVAFGSKHGLAETTMVAIPLMLAGLGVAVAYRARLWNIGAEGQMLVGALSTGWMALFVLPPTWPNWVTIPVLLLAGFVGGAVWGAVAGYLKLKLNVNEIISTLMMNYIAQYLINYLVFGPWSDRGAGFPLTAEFSKNMWLPRLADYAGIYPAFQGIRIHMGVVFGLIIAAILYVVIRRTKWGYEINVIGENVRAGRYAGMNITLNVLLVMMVSGGLAGLAGMVQVTGAIHRLQQYITGVAPGRSGYGYVAIIVAWLGKLNPWGIVLVSFLFGGLLTGGSAIQSSMGVPAAVAGILQGTILFVLIGSDMFLRYRLRLQKLEV